MSHTTTDHSEKKEKLMSEIAKDRTFMTPEFASLASRLEGSAKLCYRVESAFDMVTTVNERKSLIGQANRLHYVYPIDGGIEADVRFKSHSIRSWSKGNNGDKDRRLRAYRILVFMSLVYGDAEEIARGNVEKTKADTGHNDWFITLFDDAMNKRSSTHDLDEGEGLRDEADEEPEAPEILKIDLSNLPPETVAIWDALKIQLAVETAVQQQAPKLIEEVRKNIHVVRHEVAHPNGDITNIEGLAHERFGDCLDVLRCSKQENRWLWLFGEAGTGKTFLGKQLASALQNSDGTEKRFASISSHTGMSPSEFFGWLLPTGEGGRFEHVESIFVDYVENGGFFFIDECANLPPDALTRINSLLSNLETWLPKRLGREHLEMSGDFSIAMADNTVGRGSADGYVRNVISAETRSRFQYVHIGYDRALEEGLFGHDLQWLKACWKLRDKIENGSNVREMVSSRFINQGLDLRATHGKDAYPIERCIYRLTEGWSDNDLSALSITKYVG